MKKLGRGWQYTTYDVGNDRVLKKYNSKIIGYIHMFKVCFPFTTAPLWKLPAYYRGCKQTALDSIKKLQNPILDPWMMGNPRIVNSLDYEQDKVTPLHEALSVSDETRGKEIIDSFIEFNKILIQRSMIDKSFNITQNFALDTNGRVILMDLGELYSSKVSIEKQIRDRAWAKHYVVNPLPSNLRNYFVCRMDAEFGNKMKSDRARAVILQDNKILMIQRLRTDSEYYVLPGGTLEDGELPEATVMREIQEETSLITKLIRKLDSLTDKDGVTHHIYLCEYISGTPKLTASSPEVMEASVGNIYTPMWIDVKSIPNLQIWPAEAKTFLLNYLKL